jgi:ADP-ribose pyrophosphatase YjhB (NUDIX family)
MVSNEFSGFGIEMDAWVPTKTEGRGLTEKNFGDETLATWESDAPLPDDAAVTHVTLLPYRGSRVVLAWRDGRVWLPEGEVAPGETAEQAIARVALEQAGISAQQSKHLGHWRCRATIHHRTLPAGTITYRAVYGLDVSELADFPTREGYERRIVMQRDLMALLRDRYFERSLELTGALDRFVIERARAGA